LFSDGQILVNFDVNTLEISKSKAESVKSNIKSALSKNDVLSSFSNSTNVLFKNPTIGAFVVNGKYI
jgi:hypothetical protein